MTTLSLPGRKVELTDQDKAEEQALRQFGITIERRQEVAGVFRGEALSRQLVDIANEEEEQNVLELQFEGGVTQYISIEDLKAESTKSRGTGGRDVVTVPVQFRRAETRSRGVFDWALRGLRLFKIEKKIADVGEAKIVERFDQSLDPAPGLYHVTADGELKDAVQSAQELDVARPWLILIHGTASSTEGSFGGLFRDENAATSATGEANAATAEWKQLYDFYGGRVLALQHQTLSVSPVDNAEILAALLPKNATLHLVTHSRGGLIGELLSLGDVGKANFAAYEKSYGAARAAQLRKLASTLQNKAFRIEKFVRVAGPARGTILASKRLDLYLSILLNLIGAIPALRASPLYSLLKATTIELVRRRTDPKRLPGLEAMMPTSALIQFLNQGLRSSQNLAVIAGDAEGDTFWQRLKLLGTDIYYLEEHDLVVNTAAMFGGMARTEPVYGFYHRGGVVNHFNYFRNPRTRARLAAWLTSIAPDPEFQRFDPTKPGIPIKPSRAAEGPDNRPVLIVVPDVFGSVLGPSKDDPFWPEVSAIARRGFDLHDAGLKATGLVSAYTDVVNRWGASHFVQEFPWDWRQSMADAAPALLKLIQQFAGRDVRVIAHGAGGLVVHQLAVGKDKSKAAWDTIKRVLLLGTPYGGTFAAVDWCSPNARLARLLSMVDGVQTAGQVAAQLSRCKTILELAPDSYLRSAQAWEDAGAVKPDEALLASAAAFRDSLRAAPAGEKVVSVAGRAAETIVAADKAGTIVVSSSGDGRVLVDQLHPGIEAWRVEASHGDLPSHGGAFEAYRDLLASGHAPSLSHSQKLVSPAEPRPRPAEELLFPQTADLINESLGAGGERGTTGDYPITISVTHGDLKNAQYPVAVGHYLGDSIVSAEAKLDCQLQGRLSRRFNLRLYPGQAGEVEVIFAPKATPRGALVLGLGQVGKVTPELVRRGITSAATRLALIVDEGDDEQTDGVWRSAAFTAVTIGTKGGSAMTVEASVASILRGAIDANRMLRSQGMWDRVRIDAVELVELYEERAIATAYAMRRAVEQVRRELEPGERIEPVKLLRSTKLGQYRVPLDEEQNQWWQRLFITVDHDENGAAKPNAPMRYVVLSDRARAEAELQCRERSATQSLIEAAIGTSSFNPDLSGTLFELLVPNDIKGASAEGVGVVLIVDDETAAYPWELLSDPFNKDGRPYAVRAGMVRQFIDPNYRPARYALGKRALVIGDTLIEGLVGTQQEIYSELPGAQEEARAVANVLAGAGFDANLLIRPNALSVRTNVFTKPYRILHLAGHGRFDQVRPEESGMVLGANDFLTACQMRQMRTVPDLVFLNCCFLGTLNKSTPPVDGKPNLLAASIAQELISMGVKAVVAAGWAVNDAAAVTFASTFYEQMLEKRVQFGDAVQRAREEVFRKHGTTNTWGAYQCYGNPGFRLAELDPDRPEQQFDPCAQREYIDELRSINAETESLGTSPDEKTRAVLIKRLGDVVGPRPPQWNDSAVLALIGRAHKGFGDYAKAVDALEQALSQKKATMPLDAVEMLANMHVRAARETQGEERDKHLARGRELLDALMLLGKSAERFALLGSAFKKMAELETNPAKRKQTLAESAKAYEEAVKINRDNHVAEAYQILNAVAIRWLLDPKGKFDEELAEAKPIVNACASSDDYYERVGTADLALTTQLIAGKLDVAELESLYRRAADRSGAHGDTRSAVEHIEFIARMLGDAQPLAARLKELAEKLRKKP